MWKKLLALIMSLCMVAGRGITAFASETDQSSGGGFYVWISKEYQWGMLEKNSKRNYLIRLQGG